MRALTLSNTATDLNVQDTPFLPNSTVVATAGNGIIIQESDTGVGAWTTLATLTTAAPFQTVQLNKQFVRVSTEAPATLINF